AQGGGSPALPAYLVVRNLQEYATQHQRHSTAGQHHVAMGSNGSVVQRPVPVRRATGPSYGLLSFRRQPYAELFQPALPHSRQPPRNLRLWRSTPVVFEPPRLATARKKGPAGDREPGARPIRARQDPAQT